MSKKVMTLAVAKTFLAGCQRHTFDFGDPQRISWKKDGREVANGSYFGNRNHVGIWETKKYLRSDFEGKRALSLKEMGELVRIAPEGIRYA